MLDIQEKKEESLGLLDAIINLLEDLKSSTSDSSSGSNSYSAGVTSNDSFAYLFDILKSLDGDSNETLEFVVNVLEKIMPVMEVSVKALLLANIKSEVNCGSDPLIPNDLREFYYDSEYALYRNKHWNSKIDANWTDTKVMLMHGIKFGEGLKFNVGSIDFLDKLKYNPTADGGDLLYFGIQQGQSPYSMCRADDMDAFFWFCMHKAKYYSAYQNKELENLYKHFNANVVFKVEDGQAVRPNTDSRKVDGETTDVFSLFDFFYVTNNSVSLKNVACGTAIKYPNSNMVSICTKVRNCADPETNMSNTEYAQFFPVSDSYNGAMWYVDSYCYHGKDLVWTSTSDDELEKHNAIYGDVSGDNLKTDDDIDTEKKDNSKSYAHPRNYEKEFPIFKLEYDGLTSGQYTIPTTKGYDTTSYGSATSRNNGNLVLKILPKPFVLYPNMANSKWQQWFLFKKVLFDQYGNTNNGGHFSCYIDPSYTSTYDRSVYTDNNPSSTYSTDAVEVTTTEITANCRQAYIKFGEDDENGSCVIIEDTKNPPAMPDGYERGWAYRVLNGKQFNNIAKLNNTNQNPDAGIGFLIVDTKGNYKLAMDEGYIPQQALYACYEPSTIYQFNYQYVMGMQLFNAKQILCSALDFTLGLNMNLEMGLTEKMGIDKRRIIEIIKNMCEVDSSSVSDCFYSFSNTKYETMLNEADTLRHNGYKFKGRDHSVTSVDTSGIKNVLNGYDDCATLNERTNTLKRAITEASVSISTTDETADSVDISTGINYEFLKELIQNLTVSMVSSIITPKVIMLFNVNKQLMGNYNEYESIEDFLKANEAIVISLVKKIRDMILEELLAFVMEKIKVLISAWSTMLLREFTEKIARILKLMKEDWYNCIPSWTKQRVLDTEIPIVDYADIDNNTAPVTEKCD